jgi:threonine aldolase
MRFVSAQLEVLLRDDLWRRPAAHANQMARRLERALTGVEGVTLTQPVQANALFAILPPAVTDALQRDWRFYTWDESTGEVRWMCSWDTRPEDVDAFADAVRAALGAPAAA